MNADRHVGPAATLRSVMATLDPKSDFIPQAFGVMHRLEREHGPVVLRLGVSKASRGKRPNYRLDDAATGALVAVIDGNTHRKWPGDDINLAGDWSSATMTYAEVHQLLSEVRELERAASGVGALSRRAVVQPVGLAIAVFVC